MTPFATCFTVSDVCRAFLTAEILETIFLLLSPVSWKQLTRKSNKNQQWRFLSWELNFSLTGEFCTRDRKVDKGRNKIIFERVLLAPREQWWEMRRDFFSSKKVTRRETLSNTKTILKICLSNRNKKRKRKLFSWRLPPSSSLSFLVVVDELSLYFDFPLHFSPVFLHVLMHRRRWLAFTAGWMVEEEKTDKCTRQPRECWRLLLIFPSISAYLERILAILTTKRVRNEKGKRENENKK